MAELNPKYAQFENELNSLIESLISRIKRGNFTDTELAQLSAEIDFFEELRANGLEELVDSYFDNYDEEILRILDEARQRGVRDVAGIELERLELVKELDKEFLLRRASSWSARLESELLKSVIRGDDIPQTIKNLEGIPLTDAQLGTVLNTSYSDIQRTATVEIYKNRPEQRFRYVGGVIPTSSDECKWMVDNQDPKGYTMKEIKEGIITPYIHKHSDNAGLFKAGDPKIINENGRQPQWNCIHTWEAI